MVRSRLHAFIWCFLLYTLNACARPIAISIGAHCEIATQLRHHNIRTEAFPFDWVTSAAFDGVIQAYKDGLTYFVDPAYFREENNLIVNAYNFYFVHDFSLKLRYRKHEQWLWLMNDMHPDFAKYRRRVKRLNELLSTAQEPVIFIRISHITDQEARQYVEVIQERYPQLSFTLAVVLETYEVNGAADWQSIPHVTVFYLAEKNEDGSPKAWRNDEWKGIFYRLGLID